MSTQTTEQIVEPAAEKAGYQQARSRLRELQEESEALPARIEQAASDADSGSFTTLLMRERALPAEISEARREALSAELVYVEAALQEIENSRPRIQWAAEEKRRRQHDAKVQTKRVGTYTAIGGVSEKERSRVLAAFKEAVDETNRQMEAGKEMDRRARELTARKSALTEELSRGGGSETSRST